MVAVAEQTVFQAVAAVMTEVIAVHKNDINPHYKFNFRGIDAVTNAVGPALRRHGVLVVPVDMQATYSTVALKDGKPAQNVHVRNVYRFYGPAGDYFDTVATGESIDSGDKGTAKANSVAFRTCLLQSLCLPTDEPDPDSFSPERAAEIRQSKRDELMARVEAATTKEQLQSIWQDANRHGLDDVKAQAVERSKALGAA